MKKFFLVPLLLIYINCSTAIVDFNTENKVELNKTIVELKEIASNNQYEELDKYFLPTFKNSFVLRQLKQYDLSKFNLVFSEPSFEKNGKVKNVMIMNYASESIYFDITWKLEDNVWKVLDVSERS
ncbi:MAG: hypothetical protein KBF12_01170 [Sebaldella sp.]|nr:hypothetical protein [Sebaldella sp.]